MGSACQDCRRTFTRDRPGVVVSPADPVTGPIATQGWFQRLRARRRAQD